MRGGLISNHHVLVSKMIRQIVLVQRRFQTALGVILLETQVQTASNATEAAAVE